MLLDHKASILAAHLRREALRRDEAIDTVQTLSLLCQQIDHVRKRCFVRLESRERLTSHLQHKSTFSDNRNPQPGFRIGGFFASYWAEKIDCNILIHERSPPKLSLILSKINAIGKK